MTDYLNTFLFGYFPYLALTVLFIGSILRFEHGQYSWRSGSSQLLRRKQLMVGSVLFHVGILIIFFGHLVGLLTPIWVFDTLGISHTAKQLMAIIVGGLAGVMSFAGILLLIGCSMRASAPHQALAIRQFCCLSLPSLASACRRSSFH